MSFLSDINLKGGIIIHNDLKSSNFYLKEDLLQIEYLQSDSLKRIIDLGWYGNEEKGEGYFRIIILSNLDWDNPIYTDEFKSFEELKMKLNKAIEFATLIIN